MKNILLSLMFVFLFTGCFNNKPKCIKPLYKSKSFDT